MIEKLAFRLRHHPVLSKNGWLWNRVRPVYKKAIRIIYAKGLPRLLNGSDRIYLDPRLHGFPEDYEPEVWHHLMSQLKSNDVFVDVGAFYGLYAVAVAKRLGASGKVIAFEPSAENRADLESHIRLNKVHSKVQVFPAAAGDMDGTVAFALQGSQSSILSENILTQAPTDTVPCVRLDTVLARTHIDILKIDVEGFEEVVLQGAIGLLSEPTLRPRHIYIEVHSYAWNQIGTTETSLLTLLNTYRYDVTFLNGLPVQGLDTYYGEIIASQTP
jgi:FkbM family methyltransferase